MEIDKLSTLWKVKIPRRSTWFLSLVTVKLRLIPAQEPRVPQSVGGLKTSQRGRQGGTMMDNGREMDHLRAEMHDFSIYTV